MSVARVKRGRIDGDPIGSEKPRGKARSQRKGRFDAGLTPTEQHQKNQLMRQFMKNPEGGGIGNSEAYRNSSVWCACGRLNGTHSHRGISGNLEAAEAGRNMLRTGKR